MTSKRYTRWVILMAALAIVAAACGEADSAGATSTAPPTTTITEAPTTTTALPPPPSTTRPAPPTTAPTDPKLQRGEVFVIGVDIVVMESFPVQVAVQVTGSLPTPCHELAWRIAQPQDAGLVFIEVFSLVDPDEMCIQVLEPFEESIPLGTFPTGDYTIMVNGEPFDISV